MSDLQQPERTLSQEDSKRALTDLWGAPADAHEDHLAAAWSRRTLGLNPDLGDAELLAEVDAAQAAKYGLRRAS